MSTEQPNLDSQSIALKTLKGAYNLLRKDLNALPEEAFTQSFGDKTRTVADLVYEVNLVNDHVGMVMRLEEPFPWPENGWIKAPEGFDTKEAVIGAFEVSAQKMLSTVEGFSTQQIEEPLETEDGVTNRFERCRFMALHMWYHSGQLNFIQTLRGDDAFHWMS